jgi:thiaminase
MLRSEVEPIILMNELVKQKKELERILSKYGVKEPEEIEKKIESGEIPEHPSYEDYLSALAFKQNITELKKAIEEFLKDLEV